MNSVQVLTVDDQPVFREAVRALIFSTPGFELAGEASSGAEALSAADRLHPDLVLLDIGLPMLDGWEVARRLRDRVGPLPIIAITGRDGPADMHRSSEAGFVEHLNKPLDLERLRRCLAAIEHAPATSS